jgi:Tfp pilus assembly protein PilE
MVSIIFVILVTIAAPSCTRHFQKGRLDQGVHSLSRFQLAMETYYLDHGAYGEGNACGVALPANSEFFAYSCKTDGEDFTATLSGVGALDGYRYVLDTTSKPHKTVLFEGQKVTNACWLTRDSHC